MPTHNTNFANALQVSKTEWIDLYAIQKIFNAIETFYSESKQREDVI
jgi:hypothetical protein